MGWLGYDAVVERLRAIEVRLGAIERRLGSIEYKLDYLIRDANKFWTDERESDMAEADEIRNLIEQVQANTDASDAARVALEGYLAQVTDLTTRLEQAIANGGDVSPDIKAAADAIRANTEMLRASIPQVAEAVAENTD